MRSAGHPRRNISRVPDFELEDKGIAYSDIQKIEEKVPYSWIEEIASEAKQSSAKTLELYGPLALLLSNRIERLGKAYPDMIDLSMANSTHDG